MHPTLFQLAGFPIHTFGVLVALGFGAGILFSLHFAKTEGLAAEVIFDLAIYVILAAILGARLFYVLGQWDYFSGNLWEIFAVQNGGLVFLGGLIFAVITVVTYARLKKLDLLKLLDAITPGTALGYAIGRLGCFFNGCCFGLPTNLPWGIVFPSGSLADCYFHGQSLHPTQLYSSALVLLVFLLLVWLYSKKHFAGQIFFWGIILYSLYRFGVEFFRYSPIFWFNLTPSQVLAVILLIFGLWGLLYFRKKVV